MASQARRAFRMPRGPESPRRSVPAQREKRLMDVGAPLVAHFQAPETVEPGQCALHHPAEAAESLTRFDATSGNARGATARPQRPSAPRVSIALVGMQLRGPLARSSPLPVRQPQLRNRIAGP